MDKKPLTRYKKQLNINISPYLLKEMDEIIGDNSEFAGYSDLGSIAITQFIERYKTEKIQRAASANGNVKPQAGVWGNEEIIAQAVSEAGQIS